MTAIDIVRWLGETSLAVSILILLVLIIRKPFAKAFGARAAYALWLAPAARPFLPELMLLPAPEPVAPYVFNAQPLTWAVETAAPIAAAPYDFWSLAAAAALVLWATVAFAWFNMKLESQSAFMRRMTAASKPAPDAIQQQADEIARRLGLKRAPQVRFSDDNETGPCLSGLFRPAIFLPSGFERDYSRAERRLALAHEIAHVARGDMAATLAALALQALQWPNPLAHLCLRAFRTDQEAACDAYVLARCATGDSAAAGEYAAAILKSVRTGTNSPAYGLSLAHPVKERLMLLKSRKKSPLRLVAGGAAVAVFTVASLAGTASYGYAAHPGHEETAANVERKTTSTSVITVDKGETLEIDGVKNAGKIEIREENGDRTVKIYDRKGKLISENVYGPDAAMPFDKIVIKKKDGKEQTIALDRAGRFEGDFLAKFRGAEGDVMFLGGHPGMGEKRVFAFTGAEGEDGAFAFSDDMEWDMALEGGKKVMVMRGGPHPMATGHCIEGGDGAPMVFSWKDEDSEGDKKIITHDVICLSGDNESDPKKRAEMLRKTIEHMEESAKRDAERRETMIARMREELKKAEKEAK